MVNFPDLSNVSSGDIADVASLPNSTDPYFWVVILAGIWIILAGTLFFGERAINGKGNLLGSLATASFACIVLAILGSLINMFTVQTLPQVIVFGAIWIVLWLIFSRD